MKKDKKRRRRLARKRRKSARPRSRARKPAATKELGRPPEKVVRAAMDAITEFALVATEVRFCRWPIPDHLLAAEMLWNMRDRWRELDIERPGEPVWNEMVHLLVRLRRERWGDADYLFHGLAVRPELGRELVFTFDIQWPDRPKTTPCQVTVPLYGAEPELLN